MTSGVSFRLSVMMFLEYVIWGSWLPLLALYLGESCTSRAARSAWCSRRRRSRRSGRCSSVARSPTVTSPARRCWRSATSSAASRCWRLARQTEFWPFFLIMLVYQLVYVPTLSVDERDRVPQSGGPRARVRPRASLGDDRLDRRQLAVRLHPRRAHGRRPRGGARRHLHHCGGRVVRARGLLVQPACDSAEQDGGRQRTTRGAEAAGDPGVRRALLRDASRRHRAPVLLPVDEPVPEARGARRELDHAGDERWPDRGDLHHGGARLLPRRASAGARR